MADAPGCYVLAVLDCCRSNWTILDEIEPAEDLEEEKVEAEPTRGTTAYTQARDNQRNLILTFACGPTDAVQARSTISQGYFDKLLTLRDP